MSEVAGTVRSGHFAAGACGVLSQQDGPELLESGWRIVERADEEEMA